MPSRLSPDITESATGDFNAGELLRQVAVTPLLKPLAPTLTAQIDHDGTTLTEDDILLKVATIADDDIDADAEAFVKELFGRCLVNYDPSTTQYAAEVFATQTTLELGQPLPTDLIMWTPAGDVIPAANDFLTGNAGIEPFFCGIANWIHPKTLGFWFTNQTAFDRYKEWLQNMVTSIAQNGTTISQDAQGKFNDLSTWTLEGLSESASIRTNHDDGNDEMEFPRLLTTLTRMYVTGPGRGSSGVMPFDLGELVCPRSIVFVNVDAHAHATPKEVVDEWDLVNKSLASPLTIFKNGRLAKLTAQKRAAARAASVAAQRVSRQNGSTTRAANVRFKRIPVNSTDLAKTLKRILTKMALVMRSENSYKSVKMSFAKPNRRNPDDFNKQGKVVSTRYRPDIHVYLDTSGSISEDNYQQAMTMLIKMARKLNVNLYFNSFSHYMSSATLLKTANRSTRQVYAQFKRVPKCYGGTDYEQIWRYINASKKRRRELSIIITDFEWWPQRTNVKHPRNLHYAPCSNIDWDVILKNATSFVSKMTVIDPDIRAHIMF